MISVSEINSYVTTGIPFAGLDRNKQSWSSANLRSDLSLSTTSPLFVSANSTYSLMGTQIGSGREVVYEPTISSGPGSTVGVYGGTLTVSYLNQFGVASTQVVQVSFTLTGRIVMVVQGELITQSFRKQPDCKRDPAQRRHCFCVPRDRCGLPSGVQSQQYLFGLHRGSGRQYSGSLHHDRALYGGIFEFYCQRVRADILSGQTSGGI